jgi:ribosomal protein S27AE
MDDLSEKPCRCGDTMGEVIVLKQRSTDGVMVKHRDRWQCQECHAVEKAIGRETYIDTK